LTTLVTKVTHPDGTSVTFTYNPYGQMLTHTDGKGQRIRYKYDKAIRLTALVNENKSTYSFA
jgi:YD repeat-containing protein